MFKRWSVLLACVCAFSLTGNALAQGPRPQHTDPTWRASYWNNMTLYGAPILERDEADLDYDWGSGSPAVSVNADGFSARWTRYLDLTPGSYRFTATADDGLRIWVDGDLIINQWNDHAPTTFVADKTLSAGHHQITVEFYENKGGAMARVRWESTPTNILNWRGEYYNNTTLSGSPVLVRDDTQINFDWGEGSPAPGIVNADNFSIRWTRTLNLAAGAYHFTLVSDDGVRLWVNNHLLIDAWRDQPAQTHTDDIYLPGGPISIKLEYYERAGLAVARLAWGSGGATPGEVVVDDADAGFVRGGLASAWHVAYEGQKGRLTWTRNNDWARPNYNWARWYPKLTPGVYEVFAYLPARYTTTAQARYWIAHADGYASRDVDQSAHGDQWVSLGTYRFSGSGGDYVSLSDITYEARLTRLIAFDAIKWVPR